MKLDRFDTWLLGFGSGIMFIEFLEGKYTDAAIMGFIMGVYIGFNWVINKFAQQKDGE